MMNTSNLNYKKRENLFSVLFLKVNHPFSGTTNGGCAFNQDLFCFSVYGSIFAIAAIQFVVTQSIEKPI